MAEGDPIKMHFPDQFKLIGDRRQQDVAFEEICRDLELLDRLLGQKTETLNQNTRKDILESIRGLKMEISDAIANSEHIKKD